MREESTTTHDVFLSYSAHDKTFADAACAVLEHHRIRCWIAPRDITPGEEWGDAIIKGISGSRMMVLIFSGHANASGQVRREVERAISRGMTVMPIRIEDVRPEGAMEFALGNRHWLDAFTPPIERHLELIARSVKALLNPDVESARGSRVTGDLPANTTATPRPDRADADEHRRARPFWPIAVVASLIGLVALGAIVITIRPRNGEMAAGTPMHNPPATSAANGGRSPEAAPKPAAEADSTVPPKQLTNSIKTGNGETPARTTTDGPPTTPATGSEKHAEAAPNRGTEPDSTSPPKRLTNSIEMKLVLIPAGEFLMGSDATDPDASDDEFVDKDAGKKEKHRVRITKSFYLGIHEVTRGQFRRFVDDAGYQTEAEQKDSKGGYGWNEQTKQFEQNPRYTWQNTGFEQTDEHPVVNVSWNDAVAMATWLSQKERKIYRLPTEAEWEYACRAGAPKATRYSCGDDPEGLASVGNVADATAKAKYPEWTWAIAAPDGYVYTAPVGRYHANAWGLFDMHGNVWEWCSDWYADDYYKRSPVDNPENTFEASSRVYRGGGWFGYPRDARSARRLRDAPGLRDRDLGFRLALVRSGG
jgi:formylglycine-generating enzyme required for sulfatase activity